MTWIHKHLLRVLSCFVVLVLTVAQTNTAHAQTQIPMPIVYGAVRTIVPDGVGGWYIGGDFTEMGSQGAIIVRNRLARINADGTLHAWNPGANNAVYSIAVSGNVVYVGGSFTTISGQNRSRIAALDANTGAVSSWNPNANNTVTTLVASRNIVYAAGLFTNIGGSNRNRIAAIDSSSGAATFWNPNANGQVKTLAVSGSLVYAGGAFTTIGGESRSGMAAINSSTGEATSWISNAGGGGIETINVSGSTLYVGGNFGGSESLRRGVVAVNSITGEITSWNPSYNSSSDILTVSSLAVTGNVVYAVGNFKSIGGQRRNNIASIDIGTGLALGWNPGATREVNTLAISGGRLAIGGNGDTLGNQISGFGVFNLNDGRILPTLSISRNQASFLSAGGSVNVNVESNTSWSVVTDSPWLSVSSSTGNNNGSFTITSNRNPFELSRTSVVRVVVNGILEQIIAVTQGGNPAFPTIPMPLVTGGAVSAIVADGQGGWYIGGSFTSVGGVERRKLARINADGTLHPWRSQLNGDVTALAVLNNVVYVGSFTYSVNSGFVRKIASIAALDANTGMTTLWNVTVLAGGNLENEVSSIAVLGNTLYIVGSFSTIGGEYRKSIGAIDANTGQVTSWNPDPSGAYVQTVVSSGNVVYAGGSFSSIGKQNRKNIAAFDANTGLVTSWNPNIGLEVNTLAVSGNWIFAGGPSNSISTIEVSTGRQGTPLGGSPGISNLLVGSIAVRDGIVYASGGFTSIGGQRRNGIAALDANTGLATPWNPGITDRGSKLNVKTLLVSGSRLAIGLESSSTGISDQSGSFAVFELGNVLSVNSTLMSKMQIRVVPSPMETESRVVFSNDRRQNIRVSVVSILGVVIAELYDGMLSIGEQNFVIPQGLSSSMYYVRVQAGGEIATVPVVVRR
jgi:hypothetical protein